MMIKQLTTLSLVVLFMISPAAQTVANERWHGFEKDTFTVENRQAYIVKPIHALPGNPWIWRAYFPDWHYEMDSILVSKGFHIAFIDCSDMYGSPQAMQIWEKFYQLLTLKFAFSKKAVLEGISRGGLYIYAWAKRNPDKVSFIYAEAPVLDIKSWPGGKGHGLGSEEDWKKCLKAYHFTEAQALHFTDNHIDQVATLSSYKIPALHVVCPWDSIVPVEENTTLLEHALHPYGVTIQVDEMTEQVSLKGHHFKIKDPQHYADLIYNNTIPVVNALPSADFIGLNSRLHNSMAAIKKDHEFNVAFLGGSITFNDGWRNKVCQYLQETYPQCQFHFIPAGIPSLGSLPHSFRLKTDVLDKGKIDLLFVEAAVNDRANHTPRLLQLRAMEGLIRHALRTNPSMDIVLMAFADEDKNKDYANHRIPIEVTVHEQLARYYNIPFINLSKEVYERIQHHEFTWMQDFKDLHPSAFGQNLYYQSIKTLIQLADHSYSGESPIEHKLPSIQNKGAYDHGLYADVHQASMLKGFSVNEDWTAPDQKETRQGFVHVPVLEANTTGSSFHFSFAGNAVGISIVSGPDAGIIEYRVDRGIFHKLNLFTPWSNSLHLPWYLILADGLKEGKHNLEIKISASPGNSGGHACRIVHFLVNQSAGK